MQAGIENAEDEMYDLSEVSGMTEEDIEYVDEDVVFISFLLNIYGHAITDSIKLMWFLWSEQRKKFMDRKLILVAAFNYISGFEREIFDLLGVNIDEVMLVEKPTRFRSVLVPDESFRHGHKNSASCGAMQYSREYLETIDKMIAEAVRRYPVKQRGKLYFARTAKDERIPRKLIENIARQAGYEIVIPQEHSVAEQISMLQGCDKFMVTDGSVAHNAIFLREGTEYAVLRKMPSINNHTTIIIGARNLNATIIDCHLSTIGGGYKPFFYYANKNLCEYLGIERKPFPFSAFSRYWRHICVYENIAPRLLISEDYRNILQDEILYCEHKVEAKLRKWLPIKGARGEKIRKLAMYAVMYVKLL